MCSQPWRAVAVLGLAVPELAGSHLCPLDVASSLRSCTVRPMVSNTTTCLPALLLAEGLGTVTGHICFPRHLQRAGSCSGDTKVLSLGCTCCGKALGTAVGSAAVQPPVMPLAGRRCVSVLTSRVVELVTVRMTCQTSFS